MYLNECIQSGKRNNLNFIRLVAALSVTFGHSFAMLNGPHYTFAFGMNSASFGFYAVAVFFGLSGFLITQSYFRNSNWKVYLKARLLRLLPGLLFANFITIVLLVTIVVPSTSAVSLKSIFIHFFGGAFYERDSFPDVFSHLKYNSTNGSMWTLSYELRMYMLVLIFGATGFLARRSLVLAVSVILFLICFLKVDFLFNLIFPFVFRIKNYDITFLALPLSFGFGILAFLFKEKVKLNFIISFSFLIAATWIDFSFDPWLIKLVAWIYFSFCLGYLPQLYSTKLELKEDVSYGVYILSWPIQQTVIHLDWAKNPYELFIKSCLAIIPLAFLSWKLIEQPALRFKTQSKKKSSGN